MDRELYFLFNDYFSKLNQVDKIILSNIKVYLKLANMTLQITNQDFSECDRSNNTRTTLMEKEKIINGFYDFLNIEFRLNDHIKNGTIQLNHANNQADDLYEESKIILTACNGYIREHKSILATNNGLLTDITHLIHEISHFRNQTPFKRGPINLIFTEVLAFVETLIYYDYLEEIGYNDVAQVSREIFLNEAYIIANDSMAILRMFHLFNTMGSVSEKDYISLYNDDRTFSIASNFMHVIKNEEFRFQRNASYTLAYPLSIYLYMQYKENVNFLNNIKELNNTINGNSSDECFKLMNISNFDKNDLNKIEQSMIKFRDEIVLSSNKKK